jgi:hypothetical protein
VNVQTYALAVAVVLACRRGDEAGVRLLCADLDPAELPTFRQMIDMYNGPSFADVSDERIREHLREVAEIQADRAVSAA